MNELTQEEKDIILDFYFRCGDDDRIQKGRDLIASDIRAAELYANLEKTLCQLDEIKYEPCPDNLADITVARLTLAASASRAHNEASHEEINASDISSTTPVYSGKKWWSNISDLAAVAAVLLAVLSLAFPTLDKMRQFAYQKECQSNLQNVAAGISSFLNSSGGVLPSIGDSDLRNQARKSSFPWELVKGGYVEPDNFLCPGREDGMRIEMPESDLIKLADFPSRQNIAYSFAVRCRTRVSKPLSANDALLVDKNPVFDGRDLSEDGTGNVSIDERLLRILSANHSRKGQNLLFGDGSVLFLRKRSYKGDDIYTIRGKLVYSPNEVPDDENDIFLK